MDELRSVDEVVTALETGRFSDLLGLWESIWLEAKESPYQVGTPKQKLELAKDVSALANSGGGVIVIGYDTERLPEQSGERLSAVKPFPLRLLDADRYQKILTDYVYPPVDVAVRTFKSSDQVGVAALRVMPKREVDGPYLVAKMLDEADQAIGAYVGLFERRTDVTIPITAARLHRQLAAGRQWDSIEERLGAIQAVVESWKSAPRPGEEVAISAHERSLRLIESRHASERDELPLVYLIASAEGPCEFPSLFKSGGERVVRLIENPPRLREHGFEVWADRVSKMIEGRLRRSVIPGHRLIDLWRDGMLVFIAPGDEDFLGWGTGSQMARPIHISNFVLAEVTLHFCWLAQWMFAEANPKPGVLRLILGLDNMSRTGPPTLSDSPEGRNLMMGDRKAAPGPSSHTFVLADLANLDPEREAFRLIESVYHWFGYESSRIPYSDPNHTKLLAEKIVGQPLPDVPPETPGIL